VNTIQQRIRQLVESKIFEKVVLVLIILNTVTVILETDNLFPDYDILFMTINMYIIALFTIEYVLRIVSIKSFKELLNPLLLIDLIAILPFYFTLTNLVFLRLLRVVRIFNLFSWNRYVTAIQILKNAIINRADEFKIVVFLYSLGLFIFAVLIYVIERDGNEAFSSLLNSLWWAVITLTSVGYGDIVPHSGLGKLVAGIAAISGVALNGLIVGLFGSAFFEEFTRFKKAHKQAKKEKDVVCE
jgi:voltage-gated potassium channel